MTVLEKTTPGKSLKVFFLFSLMILEGRRRGAGSDFLDQLPAQHAPTAAATTKSKLGTIVFKLNMAKKKHPGASSCF